MSLTVGAICRRSVVSVDAASNLVEAATLMRERHVGALVVTTQSDEGSHVSGIVTDRDLVIDALARGLDGRTVTVGDLASPQIASIGENDDLSDAIARMRDSGVRRLLVINAEERLIGILSFDDLMGAVAQQMDGLAKVIRSGIEREVVEALLDTPDTPPPLVRIPAMGTAGWGQGIA